MKNKSSKSFIKRVVSAFFLICLLCAVSGIQVQAEERPVVSIDKNQLCAGIPLQANLEYEDTQSVQYRWYIDGEMVSDLTDSSYLPTEADYEHWIKVLVLSGDEVIGSDQLYFSKLPVLYIATADGASITSKTEYKDGSMYIQGNEEYASQYDGKIEIKGRGNSSWGYPNKPYKIKLGKSTDLFDFGKNKHWVLISPFLDQSFMRNKIAQDLSGELGLVQMQITWVDVILNGEYVGNYGFCEQIRVAESRIPIFDWGDEIETIAKKICKANEALTEEDQRVMENLLEENLAWVTSGEFIYKETTYVISDYYEYNHDISGGYVFEMSVEYDELSKFTTSVGMPVMLNAPEYLYTNDAMFNYVKDYWQQFENAICSVDGYNAEGKHYQDLADFDSMLAYWLTMEIMGNDDGVWKSRFAYKDLNGLLTFGPVWDFEYGCGSYTVGTTATGWKVSFGTLWKDFINDPYFGVRAAQKYWQIRDYLEELVRDGGMMDQYYAYLLESGRATDAKYQYGYYGAYARRSFETDAAALKTYLTERISWLDEVFASASQITAALYRAESVNPYIRSEEKLSISLPDTAIDNTSDHLKADGVFEGEGMLNVKLAVQDDNTALINVYLNGYKYAEDIAVADGEASVSIDASKLIRGKLQNVISFIAKDADGIVSCTNFATVLARELPQEDDGSNETPDGNVGNETPDGSAGNEISDGNAGNNNIPAAKGTVLSVPAKKCKVMVISSDAKNPMVAYKATTDKKASKVTIPDSVTVKGIRYKVSSIADNAFAKNKKITKVIVGKNVISIDKNAFRNCKNLKIVKMKTTILNKIGANAFRGAKKLTKITLKTSQLTKKSIGKNALKGTNKKLVIKAPKKMLRKYKAYFQARGNKRARVRK